MVLPYARVVVLPGDAAGQPAGETVRGALGSRFTLASTGRPRTVRRAWLDTFDWRLHRPAARWNTSPARGPLSWC